MFDESNEELMKLILNSEFSSKVCNALNPNFCIAVGYLSLIKELDDIRQNSFLACDGKGLSVESNMSN